MAKLLRIISSLFLLAISIAFAQAQDASPTPTGNIVRVESVFVRSGPSDDFLPVGALYLGDRVFPLNISEDGLWILIPYSRGTGWIQRNLVRWENEAILNQLPILPINVTPTPRIELTNTPFIPTSTPQGNYVNPNNAQSVYLRAGPGRGYLRLGQLLRGDTVEAVARNDDTTWIMIRYQLSPFQAGFAWLAQDLVTWEDQASLADLPVISSDNLTPTVTFTPSMTSSATGTSAPSTATFTVAPTETATPSSVATESASETATLTEPSTNTPTEAPGFTELPTDTPSPTATATATLTDLPTETPTFTPTATDAPTETATLTATATATETALPSETFTPEASATEIIAVVVIPSSSPSPEPSATSTASTTPSPTASPTSAVTDIFAVQSTSIAANNTPEASPAPIIEESTAPTNFDIPLEAIVGVILLLLVLVYIWFYMQGLAASNRYQDGFMVHTCPVCQRGELHVEERPSRFLGIPMARRTVRCDECRSVLRETRTRRWRYAVDRIENPALYDRFNGREIHDEDLQRLSKQGKPISQARTNPQFTDDESES